MFYNDWGWRPYVPVAERRRKAMQKMEKLRKQGQPVSPVEIEGRTIAKTFWGKSWCENLERYSDFENRLPRGRTYVRNGSVVDLQIGAGEVKAMVSGSELYTVSVKIAPVQKAAWSALCGDCAGSIDSLVELLQGRFSKGVMERICQEKTGLFPAPAEIKFECSCPDWASMCKHVAAVLYGVGARLDHKPELLFLLRKVDEKELIAKAGSGLPLTKAAPASEKILAGDKLAELFGLDLAEAGPEKSVPQTSAPKPRGRRPSPKSEKKAEAPAPATKAKKKNRGRPKKRTLKSPAPRR